MTTFTTKNQSRKRYYRTLVAILLIVILVTLIISRRDRNISTNSQHESRTKDSEGSKAFYREIIEYEPLVQLSGLQIKGQVRTIKNGKKVASYLGIPYAEPPIDDKRFLPSQLKQFKNKNGSTLEAFYQPFKCYQNSFVHIINKVESLDKHSKEDCLYLNIWVPFEDCKDCDKTKKPVMIFIHSGLFQFGGIGSPDLDPSYLVTEKDIIVITIQYRLGVFGFGSSESESNSKDFKSFGLHDQAKALEWINQNIRAFRGDPDQITLSGHGAGAISIGFHLMDSNTNKMFKRVILQGVQNIWNIGIYGMNSKSVQFLMRDSNCDEETINNLDIKACSKKIKPNVFLEGQQYLIDNFPVPFVPDFNPWTNEVAKKIQDLIPESEFNETILQTLFNKWNIFSPNREIMIGLNSDDDYQFEKINKVNIKISFDDETDKEYESGEEGNKETEETSSLDKRMSNDTSIEVKDKTIATTSMIHRQRRQTIESLMLNEDEKIKLCRLVKMYQIQKKRVDVSDQVILYRIDPNAMMFNSLEEVSFAFGAKSSFVTGLDKDTMNLWGSFASEGLAGLRASNKILSQYESKISSDNGPVNIINIDQKEDISQLDIKMLDWKKLCSIHS